MIQLDDSFDGRSIVVDTGELIELALTENASTGYRWIFSSERSSKWSPALRMVEEATQAQATRPGLAGVRRLIFEATVAGSAELELEYRRPWEASGSPARTFRLRVEVRALGSR